MGKALQPDEPKRTIKMQAQASGRGIASEANLLASLTYGIKN